MELKKVIEHLILQKHVSVESIFYLIVELPLEGPPVTWLEGVNLGNDAMMLHFMREVVAFGLEVCWITLFFTSQCFMSCRILNKKLQFLYYYTANINGLSYTGLW